MRYLMDGITRQAMLMSRSAATATSAAAAASPKKGARWLHQLHSDSWAGFSLRCEEPSLKVEQHAVRKGVDMLKLSSSVVEGEAYDSKAVTDAARIFNGELESAYPGAVFVFARDTEMYLDGGERVDHLKYRQLLHTTKKKGERFPQVFIDVGHAWTTCPSEGIAVSLRPSSKKAGLPIDRIGSWLVQKVDPYDGLSKAGLIGTLKPGVMSAHSVEWNNTFFNARTARAGVYVYAIHPNYLTDNPEFKQRARALMSDPGAYLCMGGWVDLKMLEAERETYAALLRYYPDLLKSKTVVKSETASSPDKVMVYAPSRNCGDAVGEVMMDWRRFLEDKALTHGHAAADVFPGTAAAMAVSSLIAELSLPDIQAYGAANETMSHRQYPPAVGSSDPSGEGPGFTPTF